MEIHPIAYDSMGVRSMATFVKTEDVSIVIDPAVSLAPSRYGLPPHKKEIERMNEKWEEIKRFVKKSDVVIITHYHYDHHDPEEVQIFDGKKLLLKHPKEKINRSQMNRASYFLEKLKSLKVEIDFCDSKNYSFGDTLVEFSQPVFHGTNDKLGYVVEVLIKEKNESFLFTSDVEGPSKDAQANFVLEKKPKILFVDGPMTYMLGYRFSAKSLKDSVENLKKFAEFADFLVVDHHLLRDINWREKILEVFKVARKSGCSVQSAAEFICEEEDLLEARRKELYELYI